MKIPRDTRVKTGQYLLVWLTPLSLIYGMGAFSIIQSNESVSQRRKERSSLSLGSERTRFCLESE